MVALALSATTAFSFQAEAPIAVGIDTDSKGNDATTLGESQRCREAATGDTFTVDVYVPSIPARTDTGGGIMGMSYNLLFDASVIEIQEVDNDFLVQAGGRSSAFEQIDGDATNSINGELLPATTGNLRVDYLDLSLTIESGGGVLSRLTIEAVGAGKTSLVLVDNTEGTDYPLVVSGAAAGGGDGKYPISEVLGAEIAVDTPCQEATPAPHIPGEPLVTPPVGGGQMQPTPDGETASPGPDDTPGPTFTPSGTAPAGDAALAVDAIPTGNTADTVGDVQDCAGADVGDVFNVDVVIEDIEDLIAWEAIVSYDPDVLKITDRDAKMFLEASGGQALDASVQTPNTTGRYGAGAVDTADPLSPESGSGVLLRLTMEAVGEGESPVSIGAIDVDNNGEPDRGLLLRNVDSEIIGDENGDALFDGPITDAEIRVGSDCDDADARVVTVETPSETATPTGNGEEDDGGSALPWIIGGLVALLALGGGGAFLYNRSRRGAPPAPPTTPAV